MPAPPRVTVIIATYNWSSVLRYSIGSALRQTFADFELLVVGDGCTDDSESVVSAIADSRVRWINLPANTRHQSGPNNEGLRQARGEVIAYLGHDDLWLPHYLASVIAALDATGSDLAHSLGINVVPDGSAAWPTIPRPKQGIFASPLCMVHRKRVTDEIGGWRNYRELDIGPEVELWRRAYAADYKFTFVPRLTGIKFPASWRRGIYQSRPCHEQAAWTARIESEPDLEVRQMVNLIVGGAAIGGLQYRELAGNFVRQTLGRIRMRLSLPWLGFAYSHGGIDAIRRFKGL